MDKNLKDYIEKDFRYNNLPKYYKKYFELWLSNLTPISIILLGEAIKRRNMLKCQVFYVKNGTNIKKNIFCLEI